MLIRLLKFTYNKYENSEKSFNNIVTKLLYGNFN